MKIFLVNTNKGYLSVPMQIGKTQFPLSFGSKVVATEFPFRGAAESSIKKRKLNKFPYFATVEEMEKY